MIIPAITGMVIIQGTMPVSETAPGLILGILLIACGILHTVLGIHRIILLGDTRAGQWDLD